MNVSYYQCWKLILLTERAGHRLTSSELATIQRVFQVPLIFPHRVTHAILIANNFLGKKISRFCENRNNKFPENLSKRVKLKNNETIKGATKLWLFHTLYAVPRQHGFFCCRYTSCPYCYDAINTNRNNSVPLKKVDRSDFGILSEKCEQHEREQGSRESKSFPIKVLYLFLYN